MKYDLMKESRKRAQRQRDGIIVKTPRQIEGIRKSSQLAAATLKHIEPYVVPGITTLELNDIAEAFVRENGAIPAPLNYKGFPKATCISLNEVICHGIPDNTILKEGDIVNVDVTTILDGYYGDTCRMFAVGRISDAAQRLLKVTRECLDIGIAEVRPGNKTGNIGYRITEHAVRNEFSVVYQFCGHGVGVQFHEEPQINHVSLPESGVMMVTGMTFTIEPMINEGVPSGQIDEFDGWTARTLDGKLSAQYEHTVLVTDTGVEVLTQGDW
jgi:methionyl aminopeptidase